MKSLSVSRQYAPLRLTADICFYYFAVFLYSFTVGDPIYDDNGGTYRSVSDLITPWAQQISLLVLSCFILAFVIIRIEKPGLRFALSLLPGLTFLMSPFRLVLLIHSAAWLYYVLYMTIGDFEVFLDEYRRRSRVMLITTMVMSCALVVLHFGSDSLFSRRIFNGEMYGVLYFALSVMSLRGMRLGSGATVKMRATDTAHVIGLPILIFTAFILLSGSVPVITWIFRMITTFLAWLHHLVFPEEESIDIWELEDSAPGGVEESSIFMPDSKKSDLDEEMMRGKDFYLSLSEQTRTYLIIALLAAALVLIAVRLIRNRNKVLAKAGHNYERTEKMPVEKLPNRKAAEPSLPQNARQIRRIYRTYLDHLRSLKVAIRSSDTSEDVLENSSACLDLPENAALRNLYIAARYGDPDSVTAAHVSEAKRCLSELKAAKEGAEAADRT